MNKLRQDLKSMMSFYKDLYDGSVSCSNEAFALMRKYGFVDKDGYEVYNDEDS